MAYAPLQPALAPNGPVSVDTDGPTLTVGGVELEGVVTDGVAVFTFGAVDLDEPLQAEGSRSLALLSQGDLRIAAEVRLYARGSAGGPGGHDGGTGGGGEDGHGPGGGASTPGPAGAGSAARAATPSAGATAARPTATSPRCSRAAPGARCASILTNNGVGGGGGGAIELGAAGR
ncbi:MAG: hypothetical protein R3F59_28615 [Myxococcota bacterium]